MTCSLSMSNMSVRFSVCRCFIISSSAVSFCCSQTLPTCETAQCSLCHLQKDFVVDSFPFCLFLLTVYPLHYVRLSAAVCPTPRGPGVWWTNQWWVVDRCFTRMPREASIFDWVAMSHDRKALIACNACCNALVLYVTQGRAENVSGARTNI